MSVEKFGPTHAAPSPEIGVEDVQQFVQSIVEWEYFWHALLGTAIGVGLLISKTQHRGITGR